MINNFAFISDWENTKLFTFTKKLEPEEIQFVKKILSGLLIYKLVSIKGMHTYKVAKWICKQ